MQCQSQLYSKNKADILDVIARLHKLDRAWFFNNQIDLDKPINWKSFGNIECILLQRIYNLFVESDFSIKYQLVNIGKFTIDLKYMKLFATADKFNKIQYKKVQQGTSHLRPRPSNGQRSQPFNLERNGSQGFLGCNFLGKGWCKNKGFIKDYQGNYLNYYPTLNEILTGLMIEACQKLVETSDLDEGSELLLEAQNNICSVWRQVVDLLEGIDKETQLTRDTLSDGEHPVTQLMLKIYSMETFVYDTLNKANKFSDESKIQTMGPFAHVMDRIVKQSMNHRKDIRHEKFSDLHLYRGTCLTDAQIQLYQDYIGKINKKIGEPGSLQYKGDPAKLSIYGFSSCSTSYESGLSFANADVEMTKKATLYDIHWKLGANGCVLLDNSSFPDEKEVLIMDGYDFQVLSIETKFIKNKDIVIISLLAQ